MTRRELCATVFTSLAAAVSLRAKPADEDERVPAFHARPPAGELPSTKDPKLYSDHPVVMRVYELAGEIRPVLYQLPCYCSCDKFAGHGSLLDCFVDTHGEECAICQREAIYAYKQSKAGVPVRKIRANIIKGEWRKVDMSPAALQVL